MDNEQVKFNASEVVLRSRATFNRGVTKPIEWRRKQLKNLLRMYEENQLAMIDALRQDLGRSKMEAVILEVNYLINDLMNTLYNLDQWTAPEWPKKTIINIFDEAVIYNDPYGVVLVIGAWNYPLQLLLLPLAGAIAAGNTVIVKPSELAMACASWIAETLPKYLDNATDLHPALRYFGGVLEFWGHILNSQDAVIVVEGGPQETTELLKQKFDYIFFTGGSKVGKIVYEAAAKHLTPVTLELGGKSPAYIDSKADISYTTKRLLWGKFINAGQTCVAPDYVLCSKDTQDKFVEEAKKVLTEWYGDMPQNSPDLCRIINDRHFGRLRALIEARKSKVVIGGNYDANDKFIEPTILANVTSSDKIMEDEIFGPILPILTVENADEAIRFINEREKPLTLYLFTTDAKVRANFVENTSSGSMCINDTITQMAVETLPFGGVGNSGMGAYHGKATIDTFTHKKSCLGKKFCAVGEALTAARYPPYSDGSLRYTESMLALPHGVCHFVRNLFHE